MSSQDVQRKNQQYHNNLLKQKARLQKFLNKKPNKPTPQQSPNLSFSNSNLQISNLISPKSQTPQIPTKQSPPSSSLFSRLNNDNKNKQFITTFPNSNIGKSNQDDKVIYSIDEVLNKLKKKGPSLPLDAIKNSFKIKSQDKHMTKTYTKTVVNISESEFDRDLERIRNESNRFAETLKEYENKKQPVSINKIELDIKRGSVQSVFSNNTQFFRNQYQPGEHQQSNMLQQYQQEYPQQQDIQDIYSNLNIDQSYQQLNPSQLSHPPRHRNPLHPPLSVPPKPSQIQKQTMKETLMKYREAKSQWSNSGRKGDDEDESIVFDLSCSMSDIGEESRSGVRERDRDEKLERLYEQRKQVLDEMQEIDKQLEEIEKELQKEIVI